MDATSIAQATVKVVRYVPFLTSGMLLGLCRIHLARRSVRAAALLGVSMGLCMVAWLARYLLEVCAPRPLYDVPTTPWNILTIGAPDMVYDFVTSVALVLAYASVARLLRGNARNDRRLEH